MNNAISVLTYKKSSLCYTRLLITVLCKRLWTNTTKMPLISTAIKVAQLAYKYGKVAGKYSSGETTFITRFPPAYRENVRIVLQGLAKVTYGGLIGDALSYLGNDAVSPKVPSKAPRPYKTHSRYGYNNRSQYKFRGSTSDRRCRCVRSKRRKWMSYR